MLSLDSLFEPFACAIDSVSYNRRHKTMEVYLTFTLPVADRTDALDDMVDGYDDHSDPDWAIDVLDMDEGPKVAWYTLLIKGQSEDACRYLQTRVEASRDFWFTIKGDSHA